MNKRNFLRHYTDISLAPQDLAIKSKPVLETSDQSNIAFKPYVGRNGRLIKIIGSRSVSPRAAHMTTRIEPFPRALYRRVTWSKSPTQAGGENVKMCVRGGVLG